MPKPNKRCTGKQRAWLAARGVELPPWASRGKATGIIIGLKYKEEQMAKKNSKEASKTIADEVAEKLAKNPPTWQQVFAFIEGHMERLESENGRLHEKVALLKAEIKRLKEQPKDKKVGK